MLALEAKDGVTSCERGMGPGLKAQALPLLAMAELPQDYNAPADGFDIRRPLDMAIVGSWWGCREVELSMARRRQFTFAGGDGCGTCSFLLPVSKTDPTALGRERLHGCSCPSLACPVAAARRLLADSAVRYAADEEEDLATRPMVATVSGAFPKKAQVQAALQRIGNALGMEVLPTGHAMRATGAQAMAAS